MEATSTPVRIGWICASALAIFLAWLVLEESGQVGLGFFYTIPVGLASWWFGRAWGVAAAVACLALYCIGAAIDPIPSFGLALALRALAFAAVVVLVSAIRRREDVLEHSAEELEDIRAALTPVALPQLPGIDAGAAFVPSELGVSGDFYLVTNGPDHSTIAVVGDVVGHGPRAARLATFMRARLATFAANTSDPAEILTMANAALRERAEDEEELVSAVCLSVEAKGSRLSCAVAGHPPPLCLPSLTQLDHEGATMLLGVHEELPVATADLRLERSDGVFVYTDGATDVRRGGRPLGREGLVGLVSPFTALPATALAEQAHRAVLDWSDGPIADDLCLLVLRPKGGTR